MRPRFFFVLFIYFFACGHAEYRDEAEGLRRGYKLAVDSNPSGKCDFLVLSEAWHIIHNKFYKSLTKEQIYTYAHIGLEQALGKRVDAFYNNKNKKYSAWYFWPLIVRASRFFGKSKSDLCYAVIDSIIKKIDDPYKGFYVPKKAKKAIKWIISPKENNPKQVVTCRKYKDILYCKILVFDTRTIEEFLLAFNALKTGSRKFVLDLRNSRGGLTKICRKMLGLLWLGTQKAYIIVDSDNKESPMYALYNGIPLLSGFKSVILINKKTYSASEFFSLAIKDYGSAVLIGEKTYGKGMLQYNHFLRGGGVIKISTDHVLSPNGKKLNRIGVSPDIYVKDVDDAPLKKAFQIL